MKKRLSIALTAIIAAIFLVIIPTNSAFAIADGTYNVSYKVVEAGNNNVSIADGYFSKPAKLTVENGKNYVQMTLTDSDYIKSLSGPYGNVTVVSEGNNTRVVKMQVGDLSQPVTMNMHIVVPEEIAGMKYDHHHTARAIFDVNGLGSASSNAKEASGESTSGDTVENPPTGDQTSIALYITLLLASVALFTVYRLRFARNE